MSILIKMEMPKNCAVCDVERQANCIVWQGAEPSKTGRHENCPLVELPPHGRLIDADALCRFLQDEYHGMISDEEMKIYKILWMLDDAPTIIEAEVTQ